MPLRVTAIFSDIDGTIVHYDAKLKKQGYELVEVKETTTDGSSSIINPLFSTSIDPRIHIWKHLESGTLIPTVTVPSATLGGGFISLKTRDLVQKLRQEHNVLFCLLTGARTTTFVTRVQSGALPDIDFGVCEGGGKIFTTEKHSTNNNNTTMMKLDESWIKGFESSIGPWKENQEEFPDSPENRKGPLWELYRRLKTEPGLLLKHASNKQHNDDDATFIPKLDAKSFDSAFMVDLRPQQHQQEGAGNSQNNTKPVLNVCGVAEVSALEEGLKNIIAKEYASSLSVCVNLGKGHVSAKGCAKSDAVKYIVEKLQNKNPASSAAGSQKRVLNLYYPGQEDEQANDLGDIIAAGLFDDQNDLEFVKLCHLGFAPGVAHPSVQEFLEKHAEERTGEGKPVMYKKCKTEGFLGTEEALSYLLDNFCPK